MNLIAQTPPSVEHDVYSRPGYRWLALIAAMLAWSFDGVEQGVYSVMTRPAMKDLVPSLGGLTGKSVDQQVGWYFSISMAMWLWGAAAGGVLFGRLGDRYGRVRGLLISVTTYSLFTGLSALTTHWTTFSACRFVGAMGLGGTWPLCVALVVETWPEKHRALLAGLIGAGANIGIFIAGTYSRIMLNMQFGWRAIIGMGMVLGLLALPVIAFVPEPTRWRRARREAKASEFRELFSPALRRGTIVGSLLSTVPLLGSWGLMLWLPAYVDQLTEGTPLAGSGKAIMLQWLAVGAMTGALLGGLLGGWLGNRKAYALLCVCAYSGAMILFGVMREFRTGYVMLAAVVSLFVASFYGWLPKYLPELYPTRLRASGQGFAFNIGRVLAGLGVLGTGQILALSHGDYRTGMMIMASIYLIGLIVVAFAPATSGRVQDETA